MSRHVNAMTQPYGRMRDIFISREGAKKVKFVLFFFAASRESAGTTMNHHMNAIAGCFSSRSSRLLVSQQVQS